ncbi:hypothetical protein C0J52_16577, partial [Blattella germanica]
SLCSQEYSPDDHWNRSCQIKVDQPSTTSSELKKERSTINPWVAHFLQQKRGTPVATYSAKQFQGNQPDLVDLKNKYCPPMMRMRRDNTRGQGVTLHSIHKHTRENVFSLNNEIISSQSQIFIPPGSISLAMKWGIPVSISGPGEEYGIDPCFKEEDRGEVGRGKRNSIIFLHWCQGHHLKSKSVRAVRADYITSGRQVILLLQAPVVEFQNLLYATEFAQTTQSTSISFLPRLPSPRES